MILLLVLLFLISTHVVAFLPSPISLPSPNIRLSQRLDPFRPPTFLNMIDKSRREELGLGEEDDEYDLGVALANNTDPLITKIIGEGSSMAAHSESKICLNN